jgi:hypothetical protein
MNVYAVVKGLAEEIPPEKLPPEVRAFVELLHLNVVDEPVKLLPPGFKAPVWLIPVRDEGTGETVGILNAYPPLDRERYAVKTITNKLGRPVMVVTFKEEAERVAVPKAPPKEVEEAIESAEREVPEKVVTAPVDWKWMRSLAERLKSWIPSMEHQAEMRSALGVYTYLKSINEFLGEAKQRLLSGSEFLRLHEARKAEPVYKVLTEAEYEDLWREFSEALRKEKIDPAQFRERFDELIAWNMPFEDNKAIVMDEARSIILEKKLAKYLKKLPKAPPTFSWKYVEWGLGSLRVDVMALEDAVKEENALQSYTVIARMLETTEKMKNLLKMSPDVRALHGGSA